jgi:hypothetical protein
LKHFCLSPNCRGIIHLLISHSFTHILKIMSVYLCFRQCLLIFSFLCLTSLIENVLQITNRWKHQPRHPPRTLVDPRNLYHGPEWGGSEAEGSFHVKRPHSSSF